MGGCYYNTDNVHIKIILKRIACSECVSVALVIQLAKRLRRIIVSSVAFPSLPYFSSLSHNRYDFRGKVIGFNMCALIFSAASV